MLDQHHRKITYWFFLGLLLLACSSSRETSDNSSRQKPSVEQGEKAPLAVFEKSFRPSDYDEDVEALEKHRVGKEDQTDLDTRKDSVKVEEETLQGFRIQIFASSNILEANLAKQTASQLITIDSLYIVYDPPVYKVRVGDYPTRLDANRSLVSVVQKGYPDAWIVTDRIILRKFVRVRREEY